MMRLDESRTHNCDMSTEEKEKQIKKEAAAILTVAAILLALLPAVVVPSIEYGIYNKRARAEVAILLFFNSLYVLPLAIIFYATFLQKNKI